MTGSARIVVSIAAVCWLPVRQRLLRSPGGQRSPRSILRRRNLSMPPWSRRAGSWPRSAIATIAIPCAGPRILPAACRCRPVRDDLFLQHHAGSETGIGRWSEAAFQRAMRSGVNREGQHLYPTFPYDHFTNVSDEDDRALYAFLMTRQPVRAPARENQLSFPFNQRLAIAGWKLLFLRHDTYQPDPNKAPNGIAAPILSKGWRIAARATRRAMRWARNVSARQFAGGDVDNWHAYAINDQSPLAGALDCRCAVCLFARRLSSRSRHRARTDGGGGQQSVFRAVKRRSRHRDLYGQRVRRAGAGSQAPRRGVLAQ